MSYLIQHSQKQYVNKDCSRGFCNDFESATEFKSIFAGMQYLHNILREKTIKDYKFIEKGNIRQVRQDAKTKVNSHRCRWRTN
jgi:hypothetical protein